MILILVLCRLKIYYVLDYSKIIKFCAFITLYRLEACLLLRQRDLNVSGIVQLLLLMLLPRTDYGYCLACTHVLLWPTKDLLT